MRPVTNRGLRRKRPPRTRATVTRIVSSPLPSLSTDTGGSYMSLSTSLRMESARLAVLIPTGIGHPALQLVRDRSDRDDGHRVRRRGMHHLRADEPRAAQWVHVADEEERIELRVVAHAIHRILPVHVVRWRRHGVGPWGRRIGDVPPGVARSEEHTSELQSQSNLVCRLLLEKKK